MTDCCSLGSGALSAEEAEHYATIFKVLSEPARLQLISSLAAGGCAEMSVSELATRTGLSQPTVSHHLKKLTDAGLLTKTRVGRSITHQVVPEQFAPLRAILLME